MKDITDSEPVDATEDLVRLIAQSQRRLYGFILALVGRPADAEDVLQEANVVLWRRRSTFQPGSSFLAWAIEIARLQVLAWRGRDGRRVDLLDDALLAQIAAAAIVESDRETRSQAALAECLKKLPEPQRALILRRYQPQVAVNTLAAETGKSAKAVSESLRRIRDALRQCIERSLALEATK